MDILKLPLYLFVVIKESILRITNTKANIVILFVSIILNIILTPIVYVAILPLLFYYFVVNCILKGVFKENYRGTLSGTEAILNNCPYIISTTLFHIEFAGTIDDLRDEIAKQLKMLSETKVEKLFYFKNNFWGLNYFYKQEFQPEDLIIVMEAGDEELLNQKELSEKISEYDLVPLPKDNKMMLQVLICPQPILMQDFPDQKNIYAVCYKMHHAIADGMHLLNLFTSDMLNTGPKMITSSPPQIQTKKIDLLNVRIKNMPGIMHDDNSLRGYNLIEKKSYASFHDTNAEYFKKIKNIKKHFEGATVYDIISTCICSSLLDIYKKNGGPIPKIITAGIPLVPYNIVALGYGSDDFKLENKFSASYLKLPINLKSDSNELVAKLNFIKDEYKSLQESFDIPLYYWASENLACMIPNAIIRIFLSTLAKTIVISSYPGCCDEINILHGKVKRYVQLASNSSGTALQFVASTYMRKLMITLTADNSVIKTYEEAQAIIDNTVAYLDALNEFCDKE